jgi:Skp family chaperone for outer membrane proteins
MILSTVLCFSLAGGVNAQQQPPSPSANATRFGIAVVDVSYIFKNYTRFSTSMESMKTEMESAESQLKGDRDSIAQKEEQAKQYLPSSPEFKQIDEDVARLKAEFNLKAGRIRKDFLEREAKVYYQTYMEVSQAVQTYAEHQNIGLVLSFNGDPIDPNRREDVLRAINKNVVHQNNIDITPLVLTMLNRGTGSGIAPAASAAARPGRQ